MIEQSSPITHNIREHTFTNVYKNLKTAAEYVDQAAVLLKETYYWSNTSECRDIQAISRKIKSLMSDFNC